MEGDDLKPKENGNGIDHKVIRNGDAIDATVKVEQLPEKEYAKLTISPKKKTVVSKFEGFFYWLGLTTAKYPLPVIAISLLFTGLGCIGLAFIKLENNAIKLWIPQQSDFTTNYHWLYENYPPEFRQHSVIIHGEDILTPAAIQKMYSLYKDVYTIRTKDNKTWENTCFRIPVMNVDEMVNQMGRRRKRSPDDDSWGDESSWEDEDFGDDFSDDFGGDFKEGFDDVKDFSVTTMYPDPYCKRVEDLKTECFEESLLELWANKGAFDETSDAEIAGLTKAGILYKLNKHGNYSGLYMKEKNFTSILSGIRRDIRGNIESASATTMKWMGRMNATLALEQPADDSGTRGELVDMETAEFERDLAKVLLKYKAMDDDVKIEVNVANAFGEIASGTIWDDTGNLILGFSIVFMYVNFMLGKFNHVEQRGYLSLIGLASVAMSIGFSYGFCSIIGLSYGPLHNMIPFLLLGIGIDDMFVTMQCFNNLDDAENKRPMLERFGLTMKRAGAAITITSLTDFLAFAVGGTTVLPALQSFCIFCSVGLIVVYILQATWFVAWFSIDQRRIEEKRNGTIPCYVHKNFQPNSFSQKNILQSIFKAISNVIVTVPMKILVLSLTLVILAISLWGNVLLRQEFNPIWFLPSDSYLAQWHKYNEFYFPSRGEQVNLFMENLHLPSEFDKLEYVHQQFLNQTDIINSLDSWYLDFQKYMRDHYETEITNNGISSEEFNSKFTRFLYGSVGSKHRLLLGFEDGLKCGKPSPQMSMSMIQFTHNLMSGPSQQIPAMNRVKKILKDANFTNRVFPMCIGYASWETDEVISEELYRNIFLAILCVFITTWMLLFNLTASLQVLGCVVLTLVNVGGFIHFWGLTIDTVSCTNIIISIGLCVDYSAHIAHAFMANQGTKNERVKKALTEIGPAVVNGGFSTFLAFILLASSKSHVFQTFFKVFFLVVLFGLYNGLFVLPVMLSLLGPKAYANESVTIKDIIPEEEPLKPIVKNNSKVVS